MLRTCATGVLILTALAGWTPATLGQVVIRAPFVRVQVGDGVSVQAPFVNVKPSRAYPVPRAPAPVRVRERVPAPAPDASRDADDASAPRPVAVSPPMTVGEFARAFQPREGSYEI